MIINSAIQSTDFIESQEFDICILGSGMAGAALALKLAETRKSIIVVEAGALSDTYPYEPVQIENIGRNFNLNRTRSIELGGSTNLWHSVLAPLSEDDFLEKKYFNMPGWPLSYLEMLPHYENAASYFSIGAINDFQEPPPIIKSMMNDLKHNSDLFQNNLFKIPRKIFRAKDYLLKKYKYYRDKHIILNAVTLKLVKSDKSNNIESVTIGTATGLKKIKALVFVICLGGLETPRLLLNSSIAHGGNLPYNKNLGHYMMDHPMGFIGVAKINPRRRAPLFSDIYTTEIYRYRSGLGLKPSERVRGLNHNLYLRPNFTGLQNKEYDKLIFSLLSLRSISDISVSKISRILSSPSLLYRLLVNKYIFNSKYVYADLLLVTEQEPDASSHISLSNNKDSFGFPIACRNWNLSDEYFKDVEQFILCMKRKLFTDSSKIIIQEDRQSWEENLFSASHHLGTARMGESRQDSVVNKNLRHHDIANLYISDASVFPTAGNANPSLTIVALSLRLAEHLKKT
jgi:hypothetical protein